MSKKKQPTGAAQPADWRGRAVIALPLLIAVVFGARCIHQAYWFLASAFTPKQFASPEDQELQVWVPILLGVLFLVCGLVLMVIASRVSEAIPRARRWSRAVALAVFAGAVVGVASYGNLTTLPWKPLSRESAALVGGALAAVEIVAALVAAAPHIRPARAL